MPFGGHQQIAKGFASRVPFIHLLPENIYAKLLSLLIISLANRSLIRTIELRSKVLSFGKIKFHLLFSLTYSYL